MAPMGLAVFVDDQSANTFQKIAMLLCAKGCAKLKL